MLMKTGKLFHKRVTYLSDKYVSLFIKANLKKKKKSGVKRGECL